MNKSVILVGGGSSIREGLEKNLWTRIKGQEIWSCNYAWMTMPYLPQREIFVDIGFFKNNMKALEELAKKGVPIHAKTHNKYKAIDDIIKHNSSREMKCYHGKQALEKGVIYYGRMGLVGFFALSLAIAEGYNEVFLLGYDFGVPTNQQKFTHYYQNRLNVISTGVGRPQVYLLPDNKLRREVTDWAVFLKEKDVKIWNVSLISNIHYFEKITYNTFFNMIGGENDN